MKKSWKPILVITMLCALGLSLVACGGGESGGAITVISREEGSGTRTAFVELTGVEVDKVDQTAPTAEISSSTGVVMTTVAGNSGAIGYISLGSLDGSVKALQIDGIEATAENVENGTYPISRPFNVATKGTLSEAAQDFLNFILSDEGQAVITGAGYVSTGSAGAFQPANPSGEVKVAGSSSVSPVMEKLAEAYMGLNSAVTVKIQTSDSSNGMQSTIEGLCDIGMASRAVKDSELAGGLTATTVCMDGIAVVVNRDNQCSGLTLEQVRRIFTGEVTNWSDVQ